MSLLFITTNLIAGDQAAPSLELLEFLADSVQVDQELLDPINVQEMAEENKANDVTAPVTQPVTPVKNGRRHEK